MTTYTSVPKLQKRKWTDSERRKLLNLAEAGLKTDEIIKKMGFIDVSRTQVHNQVRMARKAFQGLCYACGKNPSIPFKTCRACSEKMSSYKAEMRKEDLKKGLCPVCRQREVIPEMTYCEVCMSATHRRRISEGICGRCGKNPIHKERSIALCVKCLDSQNRKSGK